MRQPRLVAKPLSANPGVRIEGQSGILVRRDPCAKRYDMNVDDEECPAPWFALTVGCGSLLPH